MSTFRGKFPGVIAQAVTPNPKCEGCLHYASQSGESGVCEIGTKPFMCGDGDSPDVGYAPVTAVQPHLPDDVAPAARAPAAGDQQVPSYIGAGSTRAVEMKYVVLNDQHAALVKSLAAIHVDREQQTCRYHKLAVGGRSPIVKGVGAQTCTCRPVDNESIAKALVGKLQNAARPHVTQQDAETFVSAVRSGLTAFQAHAADIRKSLYGGEWICQFKGTDLFDAAYAIREEEIAAAEEALKQRIAQAKTMKAQAAAQSLPDYESQYMREERVRVKKAQLELKLAKLSNKRMTAGA